MKKLMLVLMMMFAIVLPTVAEARGFSGGHSSSFGSHSRSYSGGTYHSGYKSPSSHVTRTPSHSNSYSNYGNSGPSRTKSFFTHAAAFGAGAFLGHMFHPFGGSYYGGNGYGSYGFSFFGLLIDIVIILIIIRLIKGIFSRRRY